MTADVDGIECDLRPADGALVVIHSKAVGGRQMTKGEVSDFKSVPDSNRISRWSCDSRPKVPVYQIIRTLRDLDFKGLNLEQN